MKLTTALLLTVLVTFTGSADILLTDADSLVSLDPTTSLGMYDWLVDNRDHLSQDWFWYRLGTDSEEFPIDLLAQEIVATSATQAHLRYTHAAFRVDLQLHMMEGGTQLHRMVAVTNLGHSTLDLSLLHYLDLDVDTSLTNTLGILPGGLAQQSGDLVTIVTQSSLAPTHVQAGVYPDLLGLLYDPEVSTLNDSYGPLVGDTSFAYQFDLLIPHGEAVAFTVTSSIAVPEPGVMAILAVGAAGLLRRRLCRDR